MQTKKITQFLLARHGETQWNQLRRLQGSLDSALTERGQSQAIDLAHSMMEQSVDLILSSPLGRALSTASKCEKMLSSEINVHIGLVERHFGDWQGKYFDELTEEESFEDIFLQVTNDSPPNGESGIDCRIRILKTLTDVANNNPQKKILVITHGDAIRCFLDSFMKTNGNDAYSQYANGQVFPVEFCHISQQFSHS